MVPHPGLSPGTVWLVALGRCRLVACPCPPPARPALSYPCPLTPVCSKFFFLASAVHQGVVTLLSSVPYAVGQVQVRWRPHTVPIAGWCCSGPLTAWDSLPPPFTACLTCELHSPPQDVGLIFLSAMASSIASVCSRAGLDASAALGTSLLTMAVSSAVVGLGLLAVGEGNADRSNCNCCNCCVRLGTDEAARHARVHPMHSCLAAPRCLSSLLSRPAAKARLASAVQYLPLPAVGGYLSYVGTFARLEGSFDACILPKAGLVQMKDCQVGILRCGLLHSAPVCADPPSAWPSSLQSSARLLLRCQRPGPGLRHPAGLVVLLGAAVGPAGECTACSGLPTTLLPTRQPPSCRATTSQLRLRSWLCLRPCRLRCACCPRWAPRHSSCSPWHAASTRSRCRVRAGLPHCMAAQKAVCVHIMYAGTGTAAAPSTVAFCPSSFPRKLPPPLPTGVLAAIVGAFHLALLAAGMSLQDAQDAGWVLKPAVSQACRQLGSWRQLVHRGPAFGAWTLSTICLGASCWWPAVIYRLRTTDISLLPLLPHCSRPARAPSGRCGPCLTCPAARWPACTWGLRCSKWAR